MAVEVLPENLHFEFYGIKDPSDQPVYSYDIPRSA
jgi:hypothetical protein